ncbi:cation transporter [Candidatus Bathyarchaeota archaeon]|nr:cation transporter [Candidatus Bathyarchaeota archaeon]
MTTEIVKEIPIKRMDCPTCILTLEKTVKKIPGVKETQGNYLKKTLRVTYTDPSQLLSIEKSIEDLGYEISYKQYPSLIEKIKNLFKQEESNDILTLTDDAFDLKIVDQNILAAVIFSSRTCPVCQVIKSKLTDLVKNYKDIINFYEMDVSYTETWKKYDVMGLPTIIIFKNSKPEDRFTASLNLDEFEKILQKNFEK